MNVTRDKVMKIIENQSLVQITQLGVWPKHGGVIYSLSPIRQTATALGAIAGRVGALLAPLLNVLGMYHWFIPTTVFSSITLISGALGFLLPETRRKELPDSTDEVGNKK